MLNQLVIGDLHGSLPAFYNILQRAGAAQQSPNSKWGIERTPGWEITQVGDLANMGPDGKPYRGFASQDHHALEMARDGFIDHLLVGNHEAPYTHGLTTSNWEGMAQNSQLHPDTMRHIGALTRMGQYKAAHAIGDTLITHAGVMPKWLSKFQGKNKHMDAGQAADYLNERLIDRATDPSGRYQPIIDEYPSNIFWARDEYDWPYEAYKHSWDKMPFRQVVGHTPVHKNRLGEFVMDDGGGHYEGKSEYDPRKKIWHIDTGSYSRGIGSGLVHRGNDWEVVQ